MGYAGGEVLKIHLRFEKLPLEAGKKMFSYRVINVTFKEDIGIIHFRGGWRQYVFRAKPDVDMSRSCHREVDSFINQLMDAWKPRKKITISLREAWSAFRCKVEGAPKPTLDTFKMWNDFQEIVEAQEK